MSLRLPALLAAAGLLLADAPAGAPSLAAANLPASNLPATNQTGPNPAAPNLTAHVAAGLAAHRAQYQLTLEQGQSAGEVVAATGTMSYEVMDVCDGWAVQQRLEMAVTNRDGQDIQMVSDYATWEAKNGLRFRFRSRQTTDTATTELSAGDAVLERAGGPGSVHYDQPAESTKKLPPGTLFPMWHTATIIAIAEQGRRFLSVPLFDGTTDNGAQDTFVTVLNWHKPRPAPFPALSTLPSGRVHVAFFDRGGEKITPDYEVGMRYWENGVADNLRMDFGDFVMLGKMKEFKLLPPRRC